MKINKKLLRAIRRSEYAYELYSEKRIFFQAYRIYKANKIVYTYLQEYLLECPIEEVDNVCIYIYHLEDWMSQFNEFKKDINLTDEFVFKRFDSSISYPKDFVNKLKRIL